MPRGIPRLPRRKVAPTIQNKTQNEERKMPEPSQESGQEQRQESSPRHAGASIYNEVNNMEFTTQDRGPVAEGEVTERFFPGEMRDRIYLSPEDLHEMGMEGAVPASLADTAIKGDKVYTCVRAPNRYGKQEPGRLRRLKMRNRSVHIPLTPEGEPYYATEDLIYVVQDRAEYLKKLAAHNKASENFTKGVIEGAVEAAGPSAGATINVFKGDEDSLRKEKAQARVTLAPLKREWPRHMTLADMEKFQGAEETLRTERWYARGGRSERPGEYEEYEAKLAEAKKKGGKKTFSFPGQPAK